MLLKHSRDIVVDVLPKIIRYRIPLYLPTEQQVWEASQLVLEVVPETVPKAVEFDQLLQYVKKEKELRVELR